MMYEILQDFYDSLDGRDPPGDETCDICGRENVRVWRTSRPTADGLQGAKLCGPCLRDGMELQGMARCE